MGKGRGGGDRQIRGKPRPSTRKSKIIKEDLKIIGGGRLQPSRSGGANPQALGRWAGSQGRKGIGKQSVGRQTGGQRMTTVSGGGLQTKLQKDRGEEIGGDREQAQAREGKVESRRGGEGVR